VPKLTQAAPRRQARNLADAIRELQAEHLPAELFTSHIIDVSREASPSSKLHSAYRRQNGTWTQSSCSALESPLELTLDCVSLDQMLTHDLCQTCWSGKGLEHYITGIRVRYVFPGSKQNNRAPLSFLLDLIGIRRRLAAYQDLSAANLTPAKVAAITSRLKEVDDFVGIRGHYFLVVYPYLEEVVEGLLRLAREVRTASALDNRVRDTVLSAVRRAKAPKWWGEDLLPEEDETEVILVTSRLPWYPNTNKPAQQLIKTFATSVKDSASIVRAPRFAIDYLLATGSWDNTYVAVVYPPADPKTLETALGLWDTASSGPLRDFRRALAAAVLLDQPNMA